MLKKRPFNFAPQLEAWNETIKGPQHRNETYKHETTTVITSTIDYEEGLREAQQERQSNGTTIGNKRPEREIVLEGVQRTFDSEEKVKLV
jgi:hypothetical protein